MVNGVGLGVALLGKVKSTDRDGARAGAFVVAASVFAVTNNTGSGLTPLWVCGLGTGSRAIHDRCRRQFALWRES
jgi:hypothetical protein